MKSIKKNFVYNVAYQILLILIPLITTPYVSRILGADGVGIYSYTYTIASFFMLAAMLGVKNYGNRSVAAVRDNRESLSEVFCQIYGLQFWCALFAAVLYFCCVAFLEQSYQTVALIQGIYLISGLLDVSWLFFGLEEFRITVSRNIVIKLMDLACIFIFVRAREDLWKYALIMTLGVLVSQAYLWLYVPRFVDLRRPGVRGMLSHLRSELTLFIPVIAVSVYRMMDKIMLGQMSTITQLGFYESTEKIISIPLGVITALGTVMLPRMSNLAARGENDRSRRYIYHSILFAVFLAAAMAFGIAGTAQDLVPLFLGEGYLPCVQLLRVMSGTVVFMAWANVIRTQYLIPNRWDRSYIVSVTVGAAVNLAVNGVLIPRMAAMGAVIGTLCAEGSVCLCQTWMVRRELEVGRYARDAAPFLLIGAAMLAPIAWMHRILGNPAALLMEIAVGGAVYLLLAAIYLRLIRYPVMMALIQKLRGKSCKTGHSR